MILPRYPVYVISKGRSDCALTARFLIRDKVPFRLVVEPQEAEAYAAVYGQEYIESLPFSNLGQGSIPARNWVWEHSIKAGADKHWILDDNIIDLWRLRNGERLRCAAPTALSTIEGFSVRYDNLALIGMNAKSFVTHRMQQQGIPFLVNCHVYSNFLIRNDLPFRWRGRYNEDTDLCLQVLSRGWCTVQTQAVLMDKTTTLTMKGGNTDELYSGDGRLKMARSLERQWPHVVRVSRRWGRPQHSINWRVFRAPLILKPGIDLSAIPPNEYGLTLKVLKPVQNPDLRKYVESINGPTS